MNPGKLITLEGGEGVGKTTNLEMIAHYLRGQGKDIVVTREPGGTRLGEAVRLLLLDRETEPLDEMAELLLMFTARAQHLHRVIRPALRAGRWILSDRFTDASYAYQGGGRGIDRTRIQALEEWVQGSLRPDLTLLLDAPPEVGLERARRRGAPDRFESEQVAFFQKVRREYLQLAARFPERIKHVDATQPLAVVQSEIIGHLQCLLKSAPSPA